MSDPFRLGLVGVLALLVLAAASLWSARGAAPALPPKPEPLRLAGPKRPAPALGPLPTGALLLLAALALRLVALDQRPITGDEAFSALFARQAPPGLWQALAAQNEPHPPLYYTLLHLWMGLLGDEPFALRLLSALLGALAVPLTYLLGRALFGPAAGLLAGLLLGVSAFHLWISRDTRMYALLATTAAASSWLLVAAVRRRSGRWWAGYTLATVALLASHYFGGFLLAGHAALVLLWPDPADASGAPVGLGPRSDALVAGNGRSASARLRPWAAALAGALLLYLPWLALAAPTLLGHVKTWIWPVDLPTYLGRTLLAFLVAPLESAGPPVFEPALGTLGLTWAAVLVIGAARAALRPSCLGAPGRAALALVLGPLAAVYLASLARPLFLERFMAFLLPPFLVALAGLALQLAAPRRWPVVAVTALFIGGSLWLHTAALLDPRPRELGLHVAAAFIRERARPGDLVVYNFPDPAYDYYLERGAPPYRTLVAPQSAGAGPDAVAAELAPALAGTPRDAYDASRGVPALRVWLLPQPLDWWDREGQVQRWLELHAVRRLESWPGAVQVQRYDTAEQVRAEDPDCPEGTFGGQLHLGPCAVPRGPLAPGQTLELALFWSASGAVEADYTVFLHFTDPSGRVIAQADGPPGGAAAPPTSRWRSGERFADRRALALPPDLPPGRYQVRVGLYRRESGQRLPTASGADHLVLAELTAGP